MEKKFEQGQEVLHKNLGKGVFISYDIHDGESVVEFTDEMGYEDVLCVSTNLLSEIK